MSPLSPLLLAETAEDLGLQLVGQRDGAAIRVGGLLLGTRDDVRVAGTATPNVVVSVLGAGSDGRLGDHILVGAHRRLLACIANVGGSCTQRKKVVIVSAQFFLMIGAG